MAQDKNNVIAFQSGAHIIKYDSGDSEITDSKNGLPAIYGIENRYPSLLPGPSDPYPNQRRSNGNLDHAYSTQHLHAFHKDRANGVAGSRVGEFYWKGPHDEGVWMDQIENPDIFGENVYSTADERNDAISAHRRLDPGIGELEGNRKRIIESLAMLDSMQLVNTNNRNMMLNMLTESAADGYLARSNYEVMLSNIIDIRETHMKTQRKINDMARLGEIKTYYKMYYSTKKKIILETIMVVLLLMFLYVFRRNGALSEELFNLFFVIVLFVYLFFRLSWQIVDFVSRDKRYFDKYDWGHLDGSYNFYDFDDVENVNNKYIKDVKTCLQTFVDNLKTHLSSYNNLVGMMCSYTLHAREIVKFMEEGQGGNPINLHNGLLQILIYETLYNQYIENCGKNLRDVSNSMPIPFRYDMEPEDDECPKPEVLPIDEKKYSWQCMQLRRQVDAYMVNKINGKINIDQRNPNKSFSGSIHDEPSREQVKKWIKTSNNKNILDLAYLANNFTLELRLEAWFKVLYEEINKIITGTNNFKDVHASSPTKTYTITERPTVDSIQATENKCKMEPLKDPNAGTNTENPEECEKDEVF